MVILDTNVVSALMRASENPSVVAWLDGQPRLSIWTTSITVMEVRYGLAIMPAGRRKDTRTAEFDRILADDIQDRIRLFDHAAAESAAALMGARHLSGRSVDLRYTMIAGIALSQNATIATRNARHFDDLRVPVVDPWTP
jgi:predicted nucleic acid-binding protein